MLQSDGRISRYAFWLGPAMVVLGLAIPVRAADRTTFLIPLSPESSQVDLPSGTFADAAFGQAASDGWKGYLKVWEAHYQNPADETIRRFLGLPLKRAFEMKARRGRSAPRSLRWAAGSFAQVDTPHFVIYSRAAESPSTLVAEDLERCYWAWTQMFFPLWEASAQVSAAFEGWRDDETVTELLKRQSSRVTIRRKLRVVLFRDAAEYQRTLGPEYPGIERSTGFYDNGKQTIYLYAAEVDDPATRRHELVHQLFREATRSGLGRDFPGEKEGFWLIEGIAGYCESLRLGETYGTVGGWDASRLQFARFRTISAADVMPIDELRTDGRLAAQQRQDITRWYAHAIAQTHHLLDGGDVQQRQWVYQQLANRYKIRGELPKIDTEATLGELDRSTREFLLVDDDHLEANPIHHPLRELVLAECRVTAEGLRNVPPSPELRWLDLTRLPIGNEDVRRIAPIPRSLEQLRLEATRVDAGLKDFLQQATSLNELDLSDTEMDDSVVQAIANANELAILYLTGTNVTDQSIGVLASMKNLQSVDLQRSRVTEAGIARLRAARPDVQINP